MVDVAEIRRCLPVWMRPRIVVGDLVDAYYYASAGCDVLLISDTERPLGGRRIPYAAGSYTIMRLGQAICGMGFDAILLDTKLDMPTQDFINTYAPRINPPPSVAASVQTFDTW